MSIMRAMQMAAAGGGGPEGAWDLSYAYYNDPNSPDLSTAAYLSDSFSVISQEIQPEGIFFKPDGTKMYIVGSSGDDVNEYSLSTAWIVSTASYVQNFSVSTEITTPVGLFFRADGLKMYVTDDSFADVNEYDLSTAWDISTASYLQNFSVIAQDVNPTGIFFKPDGFKMYVLGNFTDIVSEYDLSTAWDISTASHLQNFSVSAQDTAPDDLSFSSNGKKMYVLGNTGNDVNEYTLSTAWDISTASFTTLYSVSTQDTEPNGLFLSETANSFYVVGGQNDTVYRYRIRGGFSVAAQETSPQAIFFKPDGTKMYILGDSGNDVNEYDLSTAWDTSTASYLQNFSVSAQLGSPNGLFFKPDGTKMYVSSGSKNEGGEINEYSLSTAWDISSSTFVQVFDPSASTDEVTGIFFSSDGTKLYTTDPGADFVYQFGLSTPWDISTATYSQGFDISSQESISEDLFFKPDGKKMYVIGSSGDEVNEYDLSTAWDISTASYVQNFRVALQDTTPTGIFFKDDGTQMFVVGSSGDRVYTYSLGVQE